MTDVSFFWLGAFVLNALWIAFLPTTSGKAVATCGAAVSLLLLVRSVRSAGHRPAAGNVALLCFLLPLLSFARGVKLAFWRVDGRSCLIIGWLLCLTVLEYQRCSNETQLPLPRRRTRQASPEISMLFLLWSAFFWLAIVFDVGFGRVIAQFDRGLVIHCGGDMLTTIFAIWRAHPASQHLFLGWRSPADFAAGLAYENHVHPYLFTMYAWTTTVRAVARVPMFVATNTVPLLIMSVMIAALTVLLARSGALRRCRGGVGLLTLFVSVGFVVTAWRFWDDLYRYNSDNPHPLVAALFVITYALLIRPSRPWLAAAAATIFVALSPIHLPILLLAVGCLFMRPGTRPLEILRENRRLVPLVVLATAAGCIALATPSLLIAWKGYRTQGSTLLFRSGLDGSTAYFTNIAQAIWSACPVNCCGAPRSIGSVLFPAFVPLAAYFWAARTSPEMRRLGGFKRLLLFLMVPYAVSAIFLPQSIAIHPYLYDHLMIVPAVLIGAIAINTTTVRAALRGPGLLVFLLVSAAVLMSNLLALAQGAARLP